jgi:hypothetical protein
MTTQKPCLSPPTFATDCDALILRMHHAPLALRRRHSRQIDSLRAAESSQPLPTGPAPHSARVWQRTF